MMLEVRVRFERVHLPKVDPRRGELGFEARQ